MAPNRRSGPASLALVMLLFIAWASPGIAADGVTAYFDRPQVYEGDSVALVIELEGLQSGLQPDLAPLNEDFDVGGTGVSTETRIINGRRSDTTRLSVTLTPKGIGTLTVPPLTIGDRQTEPLSLQVDPVPEAGIGGPADDLRVEVDLGTDLDALVVSQQVPVIVRAYSARPLLDYGLRMPSIDGAVLTQLGREQGHITTRNGRQVRVIEWRFTLSPERSGELRIPPVVIEAELETPRGSRAGTDPFGNDRLGRLLDDPMLERMFDLGRGGLSPFQRGERRQARSAAVTLEVAPRPDAFGGDHWLPAEALTIEDSWADEPPILAVGEPATRTLTLTAKGLSGNQIPEIEVPAPPGLRVYPETTETETRTDGATVIGVSRQQVTLIPSSGGEIRLPAVQVPWWDTRTQRERVAEVPAMSVQVAGPVASPAADGLGDQAAADAQLPPAAAQPDQPPAPAEPSSETAAGDATDDDLTLGLALGISAALLLLAVTGVLLWRRARQGLVRAGSDATPTAPPRRSTAVERERLRLACEQNDAPAAAKALLAWTAAIWPEDPPANLAAVAERAEHGEDQIRALEHRLYAPSALDWEGAPLWQAVKDGLEAGRKGRDSGTDDLPPLYPTRA